LLLSRYINKKVWERFNRNRTKSLKKCWSIRCCRRCMPGFNL